MRKSKLFFIMFLLAVSFPTAVFCQEYLDGEKRFMKLTEISSDKTYGYRMANPIKVGSNKNAIGAYLNTLKTLDGDIFHIYDMKYDYMDQYNLTEVVLTFEQKKELVTIYFRSDLLETPKAVNGFTYKTIDDLPKVIVFPADSILKVHPCSQTVYSVDASLVKDKLGHFPQPTTTPSFKGGIDELIKYFSKHSLTDEKAKQLHFRVSIAFVVSCNGNAGNFVIVSQGRGDLATYANQILAIVNKMPQCWQPATFDGKPVDCYQMLTFWPLNGQLDKVYYEK